LTLNPIVAIGHLAGYSFHRYWDNDIDIMGTSGCEGRQVRELFVLGYLMYGISSIYGAIFRNKHRSIITHFPVISSFIRLCFLFWWIPLLYYFEWIKFEYWHWEIFYSFLWGISQADTCHYFADLIWKEDFDGKLKRRQ